MFDTQSEDNFFSSSATELVPMLPDELCLPVCNFSGNGGDTFSEIDSNNLQATTLNFDLDLVVGFSSQFADDSSVNSELLNLDTGLKLATEKLASFAGNSDFSDAMAIAFGEVSASSSTLELLDDLAEGKVNIEIISGTNLPFSGAFGDNTVFLSEDFLSSNSNNPQGIAEVIIEEFGHYLDFHLNPIDSEGDEGEIFARLVQGLPLSEEQLINLKTEDDHGTIIIDHNAIEVEFMVENEGIFTVGNSGQTTIDFLLDSGVYQSQLGIFSLAGMDDLARDSVEFRAEAARRALTNSSQGYVVVSDNTQGARLSGDVETLDHNSGDYNGTPTFSLDNTAQYALILVPNGTLQDVVDNPDGEGSLRPLFSLADANPNGTSHFADLGNSSFGIEDLRSDLNSDIDYNDIIIQIQGAQANAIALDDVIDPNREWRSSTGGQELFTLIADNINFAQENILITTNSGLQYIDLEDTDGAIPTTGQLITVDYTGTLTDGTVFDSSIERGVPFQFTLGIGQVIAGWDEGLATMSVGSTRRLIIPSELGYGTVGISGVIPPNATLIFDVELLSIDS